MRRGGKADSPPFVPDFWGSVLFVWSINICVHNFVRASAPVTNCSKGGGRLCAEFLRVLSEGGAVTGALGPFGVGGGLCQFEGLADDDKKGYLGAGALIHEISGARFCLIS